MSGCLDKDSPTDDQVCMVLPHMGGCPDEDCLIDGPSVPGLTVEGFRLL